MSDVDKRREDDKAMANILHVLAVSGGGLTAAEIDERVAKLSDEEKLDALARYQEHDDTPR